MATEPTSTRLTFAPEKPTFVNIPREIRDAIYEYLLLFDGEIIPFPHDYEVAESQSHRRLIISQKSACMTDQSKVFMGYEKNDHKGKKQLSVALLGVSKKIQDEAATTLFGMNTFRLSMAYPHIWVKAKRYHHPSGCFWEKYREYFHHVRVFLDGRDVGANDLLGGPSGMPRTTPYSPLLGQELDSNGEFNQASKEQIHISRLRILKHSFRIKGTLLQKMKLKTLEFNVGNLLCPSGCCRRLPLEAVLGAMLKPTDSSRATYVRAWRSGQVKLLGTWNDLEKQLTKDCWGLDFDGDVGHGKEKWSVSCACLTKLKILR